VLLANPIPATAEIPAAELEPMIEAAAAAAEEAGIGGKALTPFLLARLREATAGRALLANRALVVANAELAAAVSLALAAARR
jgi:pseudouridine-5'-phosphate glycosidase